MVCSKCGCNANNTAHFCRHCGARLRPSLDAAFDPRRQRVRQHLQPLGIAWIAFGSYRILAGIAAAFAVRLFAHQAFADVPPFVTGIAGALLPFVVVILAVTGILAILTGYGLLHRRAWARIPAIVLGILALVKVPLGTALGVYTLWVLAPRVAGEEFDLLAQNASSSASGQSVRQPAT